MPIRPVLFGIGGCRATWVDKAGNSDSYVFTGLSDEEIVWEPQRADGGEVMIELATGEVVYRPHRWRLRWRPRWGAMDHTSQKAIMRLLTTISQGGRLYLQPHQDAPQVYEMVIDPEHIDIGYTGGRYMGMDIQISFISKLLIPSIPQWTSDESIITFRRAVI